MKTKANSVWIYFAGQIKSKVKFLTAIALASGMTTAAFAQDSITVANPSFQQDPLPAYPGYSGSPSGWATSSTGLGVNDATGPFWDNGAKVDNTYVCFIQAEGLLGQANSGFIMGETYWIQFFANARAAEASTPTVTAYESASTAGGAALLANKNITPVGGAAGAGNPFTFINIPFVAAATHGDLNISKGDYGAGGSTLLLDGFSIIRRSPNDVVIANPSFEASGTGQTSPGYVTAVAGWTRIGAAGFGINQTGGAFADNGAIPDGGNVLVIQSQQGVSQILNGLVPGATYQLSLYLNSRAATATPTASVNIGSGTAYYGGVTAVGGSNPYQKITYNFTAEATNVTLNILNNSAVATDSALLVDNVRLIKQAESINVANPSFENSPIPGGIGYGAIPGWGGGSGVTGGGPFWDNGASVDGSYVGFKQGGGLTGQPTSGYQVGQTYWIQFFANSRNSGDTCDISVFDAASTFGGAPIITGLNIPIAGGSNPFTFVNVPFTAAATNGDLNILNTPHAGGDATLLMDGFSIIRRTTNDIVIQNPSFEASGIGQVSPGVVNKIAGWTLSGPGGPNIINQTGGPYLDNGEVVPEGNNALVIQNVCAYSQVLHGLTVGKGYRITLYANSRNTGAATALITIDGKTAYNASVPILGSQPWQFISYDFVADATDVTLAIGNTTATTYFVDDVRVYALMPPVAGDATYYRAKGIALKIAISDLLTNVTDADGDTIMLTGVSSPSSNGATILTNSTYIYYFPVSGVNSNANDSLTYTVNDGHGGSATANLLINVFSAAGPAEMAIPTNGVVNIKFFGIPDYTYVVQTTTNLSVPWWPISTNTAGTNGSWQFTDPNATNAQQYYRSAQP